MAFIQDDIEGAYQEQVEGLLNWCNKYSLILNVGKRKEIIVNFRIFWDQNSSIMVSPAYTFNELNTE